MYSNHELVRHLGKERDQKRFDEAKSHRLTKNNREQERILRNVYAAISRFLTILVQKRRAPLRRSGDKKYA